MSQETFYVPTEIEYFYRDDNVLVVTANPVGWAVIDRESSNVFDRHANLKYKYENMHFCCRG